MICQRDGSAQAFVPVALGYGGQLCSPSIPLQAFCIQTGTISGNSRAPLSEAQPCRFVYSWTSGLLALNNNRGFSRQAKVLQKADYTPLLGLLCKKVK